MPPDTEMLLSNVTVMLLPVVMAAEVVNVVVALPENATGVPLDPTVCELLMVYVPMPPMPVPSAVMLVLGNTPMPGPPMIVWPTASEPLLAAVTVSVVPVMYPTMLTSVITLALVIVVPAVMPVSYTHLTLPTILRV